MATSDKLSPARVWKVYCRGMGLLSRHIPWLIPSIVLHSIVLAITPYISVYLFSRIIGELGTTRDPQTLWTWVVITVIAEAVLGAVGALLARWKESRWELLVVSAEHILAKKLLTMDHAGTDDPQTQKLLHRVRENMHAMGLGINPIPDILQGLVTSVVGIAAAVVMMWSLFVLPIPDDAAVPSFLGHPLAAVLVATVLLAVSLCVSRLFKRSQRLFDAKTDAVVAIDRLYYTFYDTMFSPAKAADVRLYRQDTLIAQTLDEIDTAFFGKNGVKRRLDHGVGGILRALSSGGSALWLGVGYAFVAVKAIGGAFGLGAAARYVGALGIVSADTARLSHALDRLRRNTPYLETFFAFLDIPHRMYRGSLTTEKRADSDYEIEFRHVSFRYPSCGEYALRDVSVTLRAGSRLAIVGENGSGKSTLVKLLTRLYDPDEGEILLNGIDIRKYNYADYIGVFAVVFQDFQLLDQPLADNVASGKSGDIARVRRCLTEAGLHDRLLEWERDDCLLRHRILGEDGVRLSRGDAQKLAIARALYKNAPFLILDEPTAALDPIAEAEIFERLTHLAEKKTAIYISHRLSGCRFCDEIVVLDGGRIVQRGSHETLVSQTGGKYRELWDSQAHYYI